MKHLRRRLALLICPELSPAPHEQKAVFVQDASILNLISLAQAFSEGTSLKLSTISTYAAKDGKFLTRIMSGGGCTTRRAVRVMVWCNRRSNTRPR